MKRGLERASWESHFQIKAEKGVLFHSRRPQQQQEGEGKGKGGAREKERKREREREKAGLGGRERELRHTSPSQAHPLSHRPNLRKKHIIATMSFILLFYLILSLSFPL